MKSADARHAVILSGGGANGAYEIGILKALFSGQCPSTDGRPIDPEVYTGTSVGSYNAAAAVACSSEMNPIQVAERLESLWVDRISENSERCGNGVFRMRGDPRTLLDPRCLAVDPVTPLSRLAEDSVFLARDMLNRTSNFAFSGEPLDRRAIELMNLGSLVSVKPLEELIKETISLDGIRRSPKKLRIAATDWITGGLKLFGNEDLTDSCGHSAILASCSIPVFFPVVEVNGGYYVDGGVVLNTPLLPAVEQGADVLHAIYLDPDVENIPYGGLQNSMDTLCRMIVIMMAQHLNRDIELVTEYNRLYHSVAREEPTSGTAIDAPGMMKLVRMARRYGDVSLKPLTVHRYRPPQVLSALVGILKFSRDRLVELVEQGFRDALRHDCAAEGCILP
jgi:predicted acylesterase/phospholipase RssA